GWPITSCESVASFDVNGAGFPAQRGTPNLATIPGRFRDESIRRPRGARPAQAWRPDMSGRLARGWAMARECFAVLRRYPSLAVLPVISGAIFVAIGGGVVLSLWPQLPALHRVSGPVWDKLGASDAGQATFYIAAAVAIYLLAVVAIFCNVALVHCALRAHAGQAPAVGDGLAAATRVL